MKSMAIPRQRADGLRWLNLVLCVWLVAERAAACGMLQHNEITHRSLQLLGQPASWGWRAPFWMQSILSRYPEELQAGGPSPDFGYVCFKDHDAGEDMHWTPFQVAAVHHIHRKYGRKPSEWGHGGEQLVAFLLGVTSHMIADINWHGLGENSPGWRVPAGRGYLKEQGGVDFGCDGALCQQSHSVGDTGSEFILSRQVDTSWLKPSWTVPLADMLEILETMNHTVHAAEVMECASLFLLVSHLIPLVSPQLAASYSRVAPLLPGALQGHYLGGVDDSAVWTLRKWTQLAGWLDSSTPTPSLTSEGQTEGLSHTNTGLVPKGLVDIWLTADKGQVVEVSHHNGTVRVSLAENWKAHLETLAPSIMGAQHPGAVSTNTDKKSYSDLSNLRETQWVLQAHSDGDHPVLGKNVLNTRQPVESSLLLKPSGHDTEYAHFGAAVEAKCNFNGDRMLDLVVGAPGATVPGASAGPQTGRVLVYLSHADTDQVPWAASPSFALNGDEGGARFGSALACGDFDGDGFQDLAVGAPSAGHWARQGWDRNSYQGRVFIFMGSPKGLLRIPATVVQGSPEIGLVGLGSTLEAGVLSGGSAADSLVMGTPQANCWPPTCRLPGGSRGLQTGAVGILYGGSSMAQSLSSQSKSICARSLDILIYGKQDYDWFGSSFSIFPAQPKANDSCEGSVPMLAVGSPGWNTSTGRVDVFSISGQAAQRADGQDGHRHAAGHNNLLHAPLVSLEGTSTLQEFGRSVAFMEASSMPGECVLRIAVGAPWEHQLTRNAGAVHIFDISTKTAASCSSCGPAGPPSPLWRPYEIRVHIGEVEGGGLGMHLAAVPGSDTLVAGQPLGSSNSRASLMGLDQLLDLFAPLGALTAALTVLALSLSQAPPCVTAGHTPKPVPAQGLTRSHLVSSASAAAATVICVVAASLVIQQARKLLDDQETLHVADSAGSALLFAASSPEPLGAWRGLSLAGRYAEAISVTKLSTAGTLVAIGEPLDGFSSMDAGSQSGAVHIRMIPQEHQPRIR